MPKGKARKSRGGHYRVTLGDVLEAHEKALTFGGLAGIRDLALVESAIARPYSGYHKSIYSKAAALTHSLAKNHGFVDGNKRTAFLTLLLFLDRSGYRFMESITDDEIESVILNVVENKASLTDLTDWLKRWIA